MDSYIELIKILKCDYLRYSSHYGGDCPRTQIPIGGNLQIESERPDDMGKTSESLAELGGNQSGYAQEISNRKFETPSNGVIGRPGGAFWKKIIKVLVHERGFVYLLWLRLTSVKSPIRPVFWLIYHHLSSKYGIQISTRTNIGSGLYIGHGCGIIINPTAKIGKNVSLSQFLTIGSNKGKAATIEDNVYIGPSVCLIEDVTIGHDSQIGAGSVVTKDIPPFSVAVGNPAKVIKKYNLTTMMWEKYID